MGFVAAERLQSLIGRGLLPVCVIAFGLAIGVPSIARADDDDVRPAPRTSVIIGGASVVLVAANDHLYAFVDRVDDNAPVADAELSVETDEGSSIALTRAPITLNRATTGMFVGPLKRAGRMQDAFMVSLQSSAGSGDAPAEIIYTDVVVNPANIPPAGMSLRTKISIASVSASIGALAAAMFMFWLGGGRGRWTNWRRRRSVTPVGSARAV